MFAVLQDIRAQTKHLYIEDVMAFNYIMGNLATKLQSYLLAPLDSKGL